MNKHLTLENRWEIERRLKERKSCRSIAISLGKSISTITREIKNRSIASNKSAVGRIPNRCIHRTSCFVSHLCLENNFICDRERCSTCRKCNSVCHDFVEEHCPKLSKSPYVCNGCETEHKCTLRKRYYLHKIAHKSYQETLVSAREGLNITESEIAAVNELITPLIRKGQSPRHIFVNNNPLFTFCLKSFYTYIDEGLFDVGNLDLLRKCSLKPRRKKSKERKVDRKCRINRRYADFKQFLEDNKNPAVVQMDTVEGRIGGKVLLTIHFTNSNFMLAFIRDRNDAQSVIDIINSIYTVLGLETFKRLFPVVLCDNGSEFSSPLSIEFNGEDQQRTSMFYCDPYSSYQRGEGESNHRMIRLFIPKGTSMDHLTQTNIDDMMNNINSYSREVLNDKTPYEVFRFYYGQDVLDKLGALLIPPNDVDMTAEIFKKK